MAGFFFIAVVATLLCFDSVQAQEEFEEDYAFASGYSGDNQDCEAECVVANTVKITELKEKFENLERVLPAFIQNGFIELPDGWRGLPNGFQYKLTPGRQSYIDGNNICASWGATLAVHGVQTELDRRAVGRILVGIDDVYIGLSDLANEGDWRWDDGTAATDATAFWSSGEPNGGTAESCGQVYFNSNFRANDIACNAPKVALCEKSWK